MTQAVCRAALAVTKIEAHPDKIWHDFLDRETQLTKNEILALSENFVSLGEIARTGELLGAPLGGLRALANQAHWLVLSGPWNFEFAYDDLAQIVRECEGAVPVYAWRDLLCLGLRAHIGFPARLADTCARPEGCVRIKGCGCEP